MKRILIIGSAGSGKSTLSQKLSSILQLPVIHLDKHYWKPNWVPTPNEVWDQIVEDFSIQDEWIMDGNYSRTLEIRIKRADLIIFLDMPTFLCMYRVIKRRIQYHKKTRPDLNKECTEKLDMEFLKWVWTYKKRSRLRVIDILNQFKEEKEVIIVKSKKEVNELINRFEVK